MHSLFLYSAEKICFLQYHPAFTVRAQTFILVTQGYKFLCRKRHIMQPYEARLSESLNDGGYTLHDDPAVALVGVMLHAR